MGALFRIGENLPEHPALDKIDRLLGIMKALRDPVGGCPWDLQQTFATIAPYTVEEAYEVADAIDHGDMAALKEELGDLLLQVVFHAQMADDQGLFCFADVVDGISEKMIRRHPHVFAVQDVADSQDAKGADLPQAWEDGKDQERRAKGQDSVLDGVARALPGTLRASKLQARAARVGFDWPDAAQVVDKIREEIGELEVEINASSPQERLDDEMGDLLFACVNLARKLKIDPEHALKHANAKFERRFRYVESQLKAQGRAPEQSGLAEMEELWTAAKRLERKGENTK